MGLERKQKVWVLCLYFIMLVYLIVLFIEVNTAMAQFYFPVTSGASNFYNYGTSRYGNLYGLSWTMPYGMGLAPYSFMNGFWGWSPMGIMGLFGGFYGGLSPYRTYIWPYL